MKLTYLSLDVELDFSANSITTLVIETENYFAHLHVNLLRPLKGKIRSGPYQNPINYWTSRKIVISLVISLI